LRQKNSLKVLWQQRTEDTCRKLLDKLMGNNVMDLPLVDIDGHLDVDLETLNNAICHGPTLALHK
jgi:hypothetical protein